MMFKVVSQNGQGSSNVDFGDTINSTSVVCDIGTDQFNRAHFHIEPTFLTYFNAIMILIDKTLVEADFYLP